MFQANGDVNVGFFMAYDDALKPFLIESKDDQSHARLPYSDTVWNVTEEYDEFFEALGKFLDCKVESFGNEGKDWVGFNVTVFDDQANDHYDVSEISAGDSLYLDKVIGMRVRAERLAAKMVTLGYKNFGQPKVYVSISAYF